jgi:ribonuclease J
MPMGGADRHRELFRTRVAHSLGYKDNQVLIPNSGEVIELEEGSWRIGGKLDLKPRIVDGLGIGDVGPVVLSDRRAMSEAGIVVVLIPRKKNNYLFDQIEVVSRGFVFMKQANEVINFIETTVIEIIRQNSDAKDYDLKQQIERGLQKKLYKIIQREPMIVAAILDR